MKYLLLVSFIISVVAIQACGQGKTTEPNTVKPPSVGRQSDLRGTRATDVEWRNVPGIKCVSSTGGDSFIFVTARSGQIIGSGRSFDLSPFSQTTVTCVDFFDSSHGWVTTDSGFIWRTIDGGRTWAKLLLPNSTRLVSTISFSDATNGWLVTNFDIFQTKDGGSSWKKSIGFRYGGMRGQPVDFHVSEDGSVASCDNLGWVYRLPKHSIKWNSRLITDDKAGICRVFFINEKVGWYTSSERGLYYSDNGGVSWNSTPIPAKDFEIRSQYWVSADVGFLAGFVRDEKNLGAKSGTSALFQTQDRGISWQRISVDSNSSFFSMISFSSDGTGILVSNNSILISYDSGMTWLTKQSGSTSLIEN